MSETAKKNAMRGGAPSKATKPAKETPQVSTPEEEHDEDDVEETMESEGVAPGVQVLDDGTWIYELQVEPEPLPDGKKDMVCLPFKVRIPAKLWARNIREASANATGEGDTLFFLTCSAIRLPREVVDRFDTLDYSVISGRVNELLLSAAKRAAGNR